MALSDSHTPSREMAFAGGPTIERLTPATITVTSGTTPVTMTTAQLMKRLIPVDCQDTGTLTLPTAALIGASYEGIYVGDVMPQLRAPTARSPGGMVIPRQFGGDHAPGPVRSPHNRTQG